MTALYPRHLAALPASQEAPALPAKRYMVMATTFLGPLMGEACHPLDTVTTRASRVCGRVGNLAVSGSMQSSLWQCGHVTAFGFVVQSASMRGSPQIGLTRPASMNGKWIGMLKPHSSRTPTTGQDVSRITCSTSDPSPK